MKEIPRKIHFFQIAWRTVDGQTIPKRHNFFMKVINEVLDNNEKKVFQKSETSGLFYLFERDKISSISSTNNIFLGKISEIRTMDLPLKFDLTKFIASGLEFKKYEGLYEPTHFAVFDGSIIGSEYNHYGPRMPYALHIIINNYLSENPIDDVERIEIKPILRQEIYEALSKFEEIRAVTIKIATDYARLLMAEDPNFEKLFSAAELVEDMYLTIGFSSGRKRSRGNIFNDVVSSLTKIFSRDDYKGKVFTLKIKGREAGGPMQEINLLNQIMLVEEKVAKLNSRTKAIDSQDMFRAIVESYKSLKSELERFISPLRE